MKYLTTYIFFHRNQTKAHLLMHSESQDTLVEDIGSQVSLLSKAGKAYFTKQV